jgi:hypothetical protein
MPLSGLLRKTPGPLGINAQRVDRIEHNDNIDTRIISEIEAADLVLMLSLGSGGMKRLQKQLPSARPGSLENTLTYDTETDFSTYKRKTPAARDTSPTAFSNRPTGLRDCPRFSRSVSRIA